MKKNNYPKIVIGSFLVLFILMFFSFVEAQQPPLPPSTSPFTFKLLKGWNAISSPTNVIKISDIQGCVIEALYWYNGRQFVPSDTLEPMKGYWALVKEDCQATVSGIANLSRSTKLHQGWNMISSWQSWEKIKSDCVLKSPIYYWNNALGQYEQISPQNSLIGYRGYWVYVEDRCTINEYYQNDEGISCKITSVDRKSDSRVDFKVEYSGVPGGKQVKLDKNGRCYSNDYIVDPNDNTTRMRVLAFAAFIPSKKPCENGICEASCGMVRNLLINRPVNITLNIEAAIIVEEKKIKCEPFQTKVLVAPPKPKN
jgi:hypothetical protein